MNTQSLPNPLEEQERIALLDIIRGFALFGILMMNIEYFQKSMLAFVFGFDETQTGIDYQVGWFVFTFIQGKFYTLFSLLFGIGFIVFLDRAIAKTSSPRFLFFKRLFFLAFFGAIHALLIWSGDILLTYAIAGLFLLLFTKKNAQQLRKWAIGLLLVTPILMLFSGSLISLASLAPEGAKMIASDYATTHKQFTSDIAQGLMIYATGTWSEAVMWRIYELKTLYVGMGLVFQLPPILGLFLLGASFARSGLFERSKEESLLTYKKMMRWGYGLGIPAALYLGFYGLDMNLLMPTFSTSVAFTAQAIANVALCLAYLATLGWLWQRGKTWLNVFAPAGRMALTNYLMQSLVFTFFFYGYGLGFFGEVGRAGATGLAVVLYVAQLFASSWWLNRFNYGPMEWVWRALTYGKLPAMKRA
ncbi:MAG: membrane protein with DUF418 domain [Idiomarinaceae bacterium HL-53]|nr:MAG: membrane protein with DUF418 domain [Idiomarinaceae bacterium HL-53]CUS48084.1 uncharacterized protein Ga0003345_1023 [Idiomarinaceae bacterium HL-53]